MMKWLFVGLLTANLAVALLIGTRTTEPSNVASREINAPQVKQLTPEQVAALRRNSTPAASPEISPAPPLEQPSAPTAANTPPENGNTATTVAAVAATTAVAAAATAAAVNSAAPTAPAVPTTPPPAVSAPAAKAVEKPVEKPPVVEKATKPAEKDPLLAAAEKGDKPQEKAKPAPTTLACYQWGEFDSAAASKVKQRLLKVKLAGQMVEMTREAPAAKPAAAPAEGSTSTRYWVHLPPQASREAAVELVMTLKSKGFDSYVVNQAGEMRNAISVGLFSKQASAEGMRDKLTQAGYPAKIEVRENGGSSTTAATPAASGKLSTFRLRNLDSDQKAKLELLASEWPQATLKSQACPK